jgi:thiamine kinase-like enzyme
MIHYPKHNIDYLKEIILKNYSINIEKVRYLQKGEIGYNYLAYNDSNQYIIKVFPNNRHGIKVRNCINEWIDIIFFLDRNNIFKNLNKPLLSKSRKYYYYQDNIFLIIYQYIDGIVIQDNNNSSPIYQKIGQIISSIHNKTLKTIENGYNYHFSISFKNDLIRCLNNYENSNNKELRLLLSSFKTDLYKKIKKLENYQFEAKRSNEYISLVHSDLTKSNIIINKTNEIFIIDWESSEYAPPEKDIIFFLEENSINFFNEYKLSNRNSLNKSVVNFFILRRHLDDVTDWLFRILFESYDRHQKNHDMECLHQELINSEKIIKRKISILEEISK